MRHLLPQLSRLLQTVSTTERKSGTLEPRARGRPLKTSVRSRVPGTYFVQTLPSSGCPFTDRQPLQNITATQSNTSSITRDIRCTLLSNEGVFAGPMRHGPSVENGWQLGLSYHRFRQETSHCRGSSCLTLTDGTTISSIYATHMGSGSLLVFTLSYGTHCLTKSR